MGGEKMNYNHFGELLKEIRTSNNLTLNELSKDICTTRHLSRIEKGESQPSVYVLHHLSKKFNMDLQEFYRIDYTSGSFENKKIRLKIGELIAKGKDDTLEKLIYELETNKDFKEGENLQYVLYGKAICSAYIDKDFRQSTLYCLEGIYIEDPTFSIETMENNLYSNVSLTLINLMGSNYDKMKKGKLSIQIFEKLMIILDNYILNNPFPMYRSVDIEKKMYQIISFNLSKIHMNNKNYEKSLEFVNKGIDFSIKENYMRFLPELLARKSRLLLEMSQLQKSKETYKICLSLYKLCRNQEDIKDIENEINQNFPQ